MEEVLLQLMQFVLVWTTIGLLLAWVFFPDAFRRPSLTLSIDDIATEKRSCRVFGAMYTALAAFCVLLALYLE